MAPPPNVSVDMGEITTTGDGRCFATDTTPAVIETVTVQEIATPEARNADGVVVRPAVFRTVVRQNIVRDRQVVRFETVCPPVYTPQFVASLQRALTVRGLYQGPISGNLDDQTSSAIRRLQAQGGLEVGLLTIEAARGLGLVAFGRAATNE